MELLGDVIMFGSVPSARVQRLYIISAADQVRLISNKPTYRSLECMRSQNRRYTEQNPSLCAYDQVRKKPSPAHPYVHHPSHYPPTCTAPFLLKPLPNLIHNSKPCQTNRASRAVPPNIAIVQ